MEISHLLKKNSLSKPNISQEESKAIKDLMKTNPRVVLTAHKGVAMVVMDREKYTDKAQQLLSDTNTYRPITKDHANRLKNNLAQTARDIKNQGGHSDSK